MIDIFKFSNVHHSIGSTHFIQNEDENTQLAAEGQDSLTATHNAGYSSERESGFLYATNHSNDLETNADANDQSKFVTEDEVDTKFKLRRKIRGILVNSESSNVIHPCIH